MMYVGGLTLLTCLFFTINGMVFKSPNVLTKSYVVAFEERVGPRSSLIGRNCWQPYTFVTLSNKTTGMCMNVGYATEFPISVYQREFILSKVGTSTSCATNSVGATSTVWSVSTSLYVLMYEVWRVWQCV